MRHDWLPWLLLGIVLGVLIGLWLAQRPPAPPRNTEPKAQPDNVTYMDIA